MLDIWIPTDETFVSKFCELHAALSGERLIPARVKAFRSTQCPYDNYELIRLEIEPHVLTRNSGRTTIGARSVSHALLASDNEPRTLRLIPLSLGGPEIYPLNSLLELKLDRKTAPRYIVFFGLVVARPPFYFFDNLSHLSSLLSHVPYTDRERVRTTVRGIFKMSDEEQLSIDVATQSHFLFGKSYSLKMPCFYRGDLYVTRLRISDNGVAEMDNDEALNIEGVFDEEENLQYYTLDPSPTLEKARNETKAMMDRAKKMISIPISIDTWLQVFMMPLFFFNVFVLFAFGLADKTIYSYFERLRESRVLDVTCLLLGLAGTSVTVFRLIVLQFASYAKGHAPGFWSQVAAGEEQLHMNAAKRMGIGRFALMNLAEFTVRAVMALSLLLYGLANAPFVARFFPNVNFGQAIIKIVSDTPVLGWLLKPLGPPGFYGVNFGGAGDTFVKVIVGFMVSTVVVGLVGRSLAFVRTKQM